MANKVQTLRTCSICGQQKPLTAFLELAGAQAHTYGDICATCRGAGLGHKTTTETEPDESSGGTTRLQIDNKARIRTGQDIKEQFKHLTERFHEEKTKKETLETKKDSEIDQIEKSEKKHREEYLERKKQDLLTSKKTGASKEGIPSEKQRMTVQNKSRADVETAVNLEQQTNVEVEVQQENLQQESKTSSDLQTYEGPTGKILRRSDKSLFARTRFDQFRRWLGESTDNKRSLEQYHKKAQTGVIQHSLLERKNIEKKSQDKSTLDKHTISEFIKNNMKRK